MLFLVATLGGAVRKWMTSSGAVGNVVLLIQMTLPFILVFYRSYDGKLPFGKFRVLTIYFAYMVFHIINPMQLTIFHGILGVMIYGPIWLVVFYYYVNRQLFVPERYMKWFVILAGVEIILGFVQYQLPGDNILNKYANEEIIKNIALVNNTVRITGTFSYLSGFTAYMMFFPFMVWAMIRLRYNAWFIAITMSFGLVACFMTGSRGGTAIYIVYMGCILFREYPMKELISFAGKLMIPALVGLMLILLAKKVPIASQIEKAYNNFAGRVTENRQRGEESARIWGDLSGFDYNRYKYPVLGIGMGATYQGATILFGTSPYAMEYGYAESEFGKVILEGGFVLFSLKIILATVLVFNLSFKGPIRLAIWGTLVYAAPIVFNVHNAAFLMMGIILMDNIIWRQNKKAFEDEITRRKEMEASLISEV